MIAAKSKKLGLRGKRRSFRFNIKKQKQKRYPHNQKKTNVSAEIKMLRMKKKSVQIIQTEFLLTKLQVKSDSVRSGEEQMVLAKAIKKQHL